MVDANPRGADPLLAADTRVGDFRIRKLLGEGAMGQVYLAQDTTLGRRVALKMIKREAMAHGGLDRFLEEARTTATFNHPNIVTLHAVGEHEGRPFLALEYIDGESLRERLAQGPLSVREALRFVRAITEAVAEAHQRGLVHADLKPENVVIAQDGRVRVVDFGLSRMVGDAPDRASGTPAYMAPERWRRQTPSGAIDVWSIGVLLHELVLGRRPIPDAELARAAFSTKPIAIELPDTPWAAVCGDCLSWDATRRPSAADLLRRLDEVLDPRTRRDSDRCPFPGLSAFSREDASDYFGRRTELDALVEQLRSHALIPIVGPSGVGKSSFVRAGLVPRLEESGAWSMIALRPGAAPFHALAAALARPGRRSTDEVAASLRERPESLSLVLSDLVEGDRRLLLVLDQFEETFTLAASESEARAFCDAIARAAGATEPWRVVLTMRDDFLGRLAGSVPMRRHLNSVMPIGPLSVADLHDCVRGPLANAGFEPDDPALVSRIVADVDGQPACLPLLQFTCQALWERRDPEARKVLTSEYEAMGGATGALATHAQRLISELTPDQVRIARAVLLSLVDADGTRRPRTEEELLEIHPDGVRAVVDRLLARRLIVATRDTDLDVARFEVAHEALAQAWPQLGRWLDETYEERLLVKELEQASALWQRRGGRDDETWGGVALVEAARKVADWNISLPSVSRRFLEAGQRRADRVRRRRRWLVGIAGGALLAIAVIAVAAAVAFARKEREAIESREELVAKQHRLELAAADMGEFDLELEPFDWDPKAQKTLPPKIRPQLAWRLFKIDKQDRMLPGLEYREPTDVRRGNAVWRGNVRVERVESRSSPAYIEVTRGDCPPSRLYLQRLPGFADRGTPQTVHLMIPTCAASRADTVEIPAGDFIRNQQNADDSTFDEAAHLERFAIDATEVTRAAFAVYGSMSGLTGDDAAPTSPRQNKHPDRDRLPVVGVNYYTATSYCRYMGKSLPSVDQYQKAFRGGTLVSGIPNPLPDRTTTWLPFLLGATANMHGDLQPVTSAPADVSPYGVHGLAGNTSEWSRDVSIAFNERGLRTVLGGNWDSPADAGHERITWRNSRADRFLDYTTGIRCVDAPYGQSAR